MADGVFVAYHRPPGEPLPPPFRVAFERLHRASRLPNHHAGEHIHGHVEVMLPTLGRYQARVNRVAVEVPSGGALILTPGDRHEDTCVGEVGFFACSLRVEPGPGPGRSRPLLAEGAPASTRVIAAAPGVHAVAQRLLDEGPASDACALRVQDALASELLWRLLRDIPRSALAADLLPAVEQDDFAAALSAAFLRHLQGRPTAATLARELGIAERTLTARCRRALGAPPLQLFRRRQMEMARSLLITSGMNVAAVADHLGFANPFHFSAVYRRMLGHPPSRAGIDRPDAGPGMVKRPRRHI